MAETKIEWATTTWNPVTGCEPITLGCKHCYAKRMAKRLAGRFGYPEKEPFQPGVIHEDKFEEPYRWRKQKLVFVCSMGDLFHKDVPGRIINRVWMIIKNNPKHFFLLLTKRPDRMKLWTEVAAKAKAWPVDEMWPDNVGLGVTIEHESLSYRARELQSIPFSGLKFVSYEPALSPVRLEKWKVESGWLHWIIAGAETGLKKRYAEDWWFEFLSEQCKKYKIAYFLKKLSNGQRRLNGQFYEEYPEQIKKHLNW